MIRALALAGGIAGAVALSQFPEFSQQYVQRLAGARDELKLVALSFDTLAKAAGMTRDEALDDMQGTAFGTSFSADMGIRLDRFDRLDADYQALSNAAPLQRLARAWRIRDTDLVAATWGDYRPAVPVTSEGLIFAGIGFGAGWTLTAMLLSLLASPFRGSRRARRA